MNREAFPPFARAFPADPALDDAVGAFASGDYARTRRLCQSIARSPAGAEVQSAATELVRRTRPPRTAVLLLAATAVLLATVGGFWMVHGHAPPSGGAARRITSTPAP